MCVCVCAHGIIRKAAALHEKYQQSETDKKHTVKPEKTEWVVDLALTPCGTCITTHMIWNDYFQENSTLLVLSPRFKMCSFQQYLSKQQTLFKVRNNNVGFLCVCKKLAINFSCAASTTTKKEWIRSSGDSVAKNDTFLLLFVREGRKWDTKDYFQIIQRVLFGFLSSISFWILWQ